LGGSRGREQVLGRAWGLFSKKVGQEKSADRSPRGERANWEREALRRHNRDGWRSRGSEGTHKKKKKKKGGGGVWGGWGGHPHWKEPEKSFFKVYQKGERSKGKVKRGLQKTKRRGKLASSKGKLSLGTCSRGVQQKKRPG